MKQVHRAAYGVYSGGRVQHDITLVLSDDTLALDTKGWYRRWSEVTDGTMTTRHVGGTHASLLMQPFVHELALEIAGLLDATAAPDTAD